MLTMMNLTYLQFWLSCRISLKLRTTDQTDELYENKIHIHETRKLKKIANACMCKKYSYIAHAHFRIIYFDLNQKISVIYSFILNRSKLIVPTDQDEDNYRRACFAENVFYACFMTFRIIFQYWKSGQEIFYRKWIVI